MNRSTSILLGAVLACAAAHAKPTLDRQASHDADGQGHVFAQRAGSVSTAKGSAQSDRSVTRSADGQASAQRSSAATNTRTGTSYAGSTTYTQGSGFSRSATCTDASGATIACGSAR